MKPCCNHPTPVRAALVHPLLAPDHLALGLTGLAGLDLMAPMAQGDLDLMAPMAQGDLCYRLDLVTRIDL